VKGTQRRCCEQEHNGTVSVQELSYACTADTLILGQSSQSGLSLWHQQHAQMLGECTGIAGPHLWHLGFLVFFSFRCILDVPQE
jgi:hypothetical protein